MSMDMQKNTLKRTKSLASAKRKVRKRNPITPCAWTAVTTVYFGKCPVWPVYLCL